MDLRERTAPGLGKRIYPNADAEIFAYDAIGNLIEKKTGDSVRITYKYDELNREVERQFSNGDIVTTKYNADGTPFVVQDSRGTTRYDYDKRGRIARVMQPDSAFLAYAYDKAGNKIRTEIGYGTKVLSTQQMSYDKLNRMATLEDGHGVTGYSYNAVGNRVGTDLANGIATQYGYDSKNRLLSLVSKKGSSSLSSYKYSLNKAGIRTSVTELSGAKVNYSYDDLYRLTSETRLGSSAYGKNFTYDKVGNRTKQVAGAQSILYTYNKRDQLITETKAGVNTGFEYDKAGRQVASTGAASTQYSWDDGDRMTGLVSSGVTTAYRYDARGKKIEEQKGEVKTRYLWDETLPFGQVVMEYDTVGKPSALYTYGLERISQTRNGKTHYYLADGQGSIRKLVDETGSVTDTYTYSAFGELVAQTGTTENSYRYTGESWDPNAGFYYLRARWMDPSRGRFVSVDPYDGDPIAPVSLHRYLYSGGSPISNSDPTGESIAGVMAGFAISAILITTAVVTYNSVVLNQTIDLGYGEGLGILKTLMTGSIASMGADVVDIAWDEAYTRLKEAWRNVKIEIARRRNSNNQRNWNYDQLISGPSKDNGATMNNWMSPVKQGTKKWYRDGGPYKGRLIGFGFWHPNNLNTLIPVAEFDNHPIKGDPVYGPDKYYKVFHFHFGDHNGPHFVVGGIRKF